MKQINQLQVETDCLKLVLAVESKATDWSELGYLIEDLKASLQLAPGHFFCSYS